MSRMSAVRTIAVMDGVFIGYPYIRSDGIDTAYAFHYSRSILYHKPRKIAKQDYGFTMQELQLFVVAHRYRY
jgi:hypothetical protein